MVLLITLGCNPSAADINAALGTATATDACGTATVFQSDGAVQVNGCNVHKQEHSLQEMLVVIHLLHQVL